MHHKFRTTNLEISQIKHVCEQFRNIIRKIYLKQYFVPLYYYISWYGVAKIVSKKQSETASQRQDWRNTISNTALLRGNWGALNVKRKYYYVNFSVHGFFFCPDYDGLHQGGYMARQTEWLWLHNVPVSYICHILPMQNTGSSTYIMSR